MGVLTRGCDRLDNIQTSQGNSTKKKLLIPVVVLMLLGICFTGAAYAYNSSVELQGNAVDGKYLTVDLKTPAVDPDVDIDGDLITFTDHFAYKTDDKRYNTIKYELNSPVDIATIDIKVAGDAAFSTIKVDSAVGDLVAFGTTKLSSLYTFGFNVTGTADDNTAVNVDGTLNGTAALTKTGTYKVTITATASGETTGTALAEFDTTGNSTVAKTLADAFDLLKFNVTITVNE